MRKGRTPGKTMSSSLFAIVKDPAGASPTVAGPTRSGGGAARRAKPDNIPIPAAGPARSGGGAARRAKPDNIPIPAAGPARSGGGAARRAKPDNIPIPAAGTSAKRWWRQTESNRRPQACKASALPIELCPLRSNQHPQRRPSDGLVGLGRFELPTSRLSSARSNQLSYKPVTSHVPRKARPDHKGQAAPAATNRKKGCVGGGFATEDRCRTAMMTMAMNQSYGCCDPMRPMQKHCCFPSGAWHQVSRKEVIQPQVPLRLPCYDFAPVADLTVVGCLLAVSAPASGKTNSHGVTGGVYKARERIHRGVLIRDY